MENCWKTSVTRAGGIPSRDLGLVQAPWSCLRQIIYAACHCVMPRVAYGGWANQQNDQNASLCEGIGEYRFSVRGDGHSDHIPLRRTG